MEPIHFTGHHISLIDLKRAILDLKNISRGLDFDFKVMDAEDTSKVYTGDETLIPKNSSVIVVRTPASGQGLLARLKGRQAKTAATKEESIVIPAKPEAPAPGNAPPVSAAKASVEVSESAELAALEAINEKAAQAARPSWGVAPPPAAPSNTRRPTTGAPPPNYECHRCGRPGHYIQNCPTNSDPNFDKPKSESEQTGKLHGVPAVTVQRVSDISTVNTTGKLIKNTKDGAFEIVESSEDGYNRLVKHGGATASTSTIDMSQVPNLLKCALSGKLLRDPVTLPCCGKVVSDASIREALFKMDEYQCPLCRTQGITPDELRPNHEKKRQVEDFLANKTIPTQPVAGPIASPPAPAVPPAPVMMQQPRFEQPPFMPPPFMPMPFMMPPMPAKPLWELFPLTRDEFRMIQKHQRQARGEPERFEKRGYVPRRRSPSRDKPWYERRARPRDRFRSRSTDRKRSSSRDARSERERSRERESRKRSRERSERRHSRETDQSLEKSEKRNREKEKSRDRSDREEKSRDKYDKYEREKDRKRERSEKGKSDSRDVKESREKRGKTDRDRERDRKRGYEKDGESRDFDRKRSRDDKGRKVTEEKRDRSPRREKR